MALIACPECKQQVSNTAVGCPHCGAPIAGADDGEAAGAVLTTTQETSKRLKVQIIFASLVFWPSLFWAIVQLGAAQEGQGSASTPLFLLLASFSWYMVTKLRIWWHHK